MVVSLFCCMYLFQHISVIPISKIVYLQRCIRNNTVCYAVKIILFVIQLPCRARLLCDIQDWAMGMCTLIGISSAESAKVQ